MTPSPDPLPTAPASDEALAAPRRGYAAASWAKFNENPIPSLVVAVIAGLVLFSFNETSDSITRRDDDIDTRFAELKDDTYAKFAELEDEIDARFAKLEENQQEIALTLARLAALVEARDEAEAAPSG